jgi:hypothetical protein
MIKMTSGYKHLARCVKFPIRQKPRIREYNHGRAAVRWRKRAVYRPLILEAILGATILQRAGWAANQHLTCIKPAIGRYRERECVKNSATLSTTDTIRITYALFTAIAATKDAWAQHTLRTDQIDLPTVVHRTLDLLSTPGALCLISPNSTLVSTFDSGLILLSANHSFNMRLCTSLKYVYMFFHRTNT